jgi:hypothetical protein
MRQQTLNFFVHTVVRVHTVILYIAGHIYSIYFTIYCVSILASIVTRRAWREDEIQQQYHNIVQIRMTNTWWAHARTMDSPVPMYCCLVHK